MFVVKRVGNGPIRACFTLLCGQRLNKQCNDWSGRLWFILTSAFSQPIPPRPDVLIEEEVVTLLVASV